MDDQALCEILQRMGEDHWEALEYVEVYGLEPASEATADLVEWGLVVKDDIGMSTTEAGDRVLEEQQP